MKNMKITVLLIAAACFVASSMEAQIVPSRIEEVTIKISGEPEPAPDQKKPFDRKFYIAGGGGLMWRGPDCLEDEDDVFLGYNLTIGYEQNFLRERDYGSQWGIEASIYRDSYYSSFEIEIIPYYSFKYPLGQGAYLEPYAGFGLRFFEFVYVTDFGLRYLSRSKIGYEIGYLNDFGGYDIKAVRFRVSIPISVILDAAKKQAGSY